MKNHRSRLWRTDRGMSLIFVSMGLLAFLAATTIAVDVGMFMTGRSQAQNAADAGAHAGAVALVQNSYTDRTANGPVVQSAIHAALDNKVVGVSPSVLSTDVTFPPDPNGIYDRVKVNVYRNVSRNNSVPTFLGHLFGVPSVNIGATATAEASPANAMRCVKPFTIPDRWTELKNAPWTTSSTFDRYYTNGAKQGQVITPVADIYYPVGNANYNGYSPWADKGLQIVIRAGSGSNIEPTFYFSWSMPADMGGNDYRQNISGCNTTLVHFNDPMVQEPGNMVGPTNQGIDDLLAKDPNAYWDTVRNEVHSAMNPSPRVAPLPLFDPDYYQSQITQGRMATLKVANWVGFFIEGRSGNQVTGRITPITGVLDNNAGPAPEGTFPRVIRLVQ